MQESNLKARKQQNEAFADKVANDLQEFGILPAEQTQAAGQLARGSRTGPGTATIDEPLGKMALVEQDGILQWRAGAGASPEDDETARGTPLQRHNVIQEFRFEELPPNKIGEQLTRLDNKLTPGQGLRAVGKDLKLGPDVAPVANGRILLLIHGTFSNTESLLEELQATAEGSALLHDALHSGTYDQVLGFNHQTLSVSPILNAATLASHFRDSTADVDVICHSRGGLVTRWWLEVLDHSHKPRGKVIFVGSPLAGTGLAAPGNLKGALDNLTNFSRCMSTAAKTTGYVFPVAAPLSNAVGVLFSIFGKLTSVVTKVPILDAGISMIPGLAAQSREGANGEIIRLRESLARQQQKSRSGWSADSYYFIRSNFESEDPEWRFWRYFRNVKGRAMDVATNAIFDGHNDLVVDTPSMTDLADDIDAGAFSQPYLRNHILDFSTTSEVHHCNYFQQPHTVGFIRTKLGLTA